MEGFSENKVKDMAALAIEALEDKKAEDIRVIDISQVSVIADYFIIANGTNKSQIQTLSDTVEEKLGKAGYFMKQKEGFRNANWVLLDFGDIIVHIFDKENRLFYDLERIWRDGKVVDAEAFR
ncbi:ribosome silencing factor [bacterium 1xD8-48]|jgi:ribosome-associated protein|nr:ribosome silencing factor [Lachnospiraceae bacterium]MCI9325547.1 ribosome silencing factor [Lachnospiraceae bacterium]NBJ99732.1 ribosome silencing factor [bacterium 1xD8-48]